MLILSRKENESVTIGENISIKIISIDKGSVKLGFEAPPNLLILREELKMAVLEENKKSLNIKDDDINKLVAAKKKL
ncbi:MULTISPECIES: carbon storage regulator CsrA [Helicobacter]|uniref:Translational regulator CsrA n=1 Tax=Helicobacter ibis TaxID=2962633 RepID=A0ABT4VCZ8_9HELI|nr:MULTISPECIES: carbon storage regulator CsrA [Helicobacter]MDA3966661.1 carbon storage regulator CsrA [Helicobacter sp. WB40]MDA3968571.1 carbon storage regulator CsrA [Helicobacter ibis]